VLGRPDRRGGEVFDEVRRVARAAGMDALCASQGDRLVVILGGVEEPEKAATHVLAFFGTDLSWSARSSRTWATPI
jgi:hypothetical protein